MRWYTRAWQRGDSEADPSPAYHAYLRSIEPQLPAHIRDFATTAVRHFGVDDAKVDLAVYDRQARTLRIRLLNGDLSSGYGKLTLDFTGAEVVEPRPNEAREVLGDPATELLVHEVELLPTGRYAVRFLLYPRGELHVECDDVRADWVAIADRTRKDFASEVKGFGDGSLT
jgi:hypothetical protein